jgi:hypothetical protein
LPRRSHWDQIQQNSCDVLWENVGLADGRVKRFLQFDIETLLFGATIVISEIEPFLDERVNIDRSMFARTFP